MEQNKVKLFLDMDGVLTDFTRGWADILNFPYTYDPYSLKRGVWDYFPELLGKHNITFKQIDDVCTCDFWANLPWMHDGKLILQIVLDVFGYENIYLLTSPMPNPGSPNGKCEWIEKNIPGLKKRVILTNVDKGLFAGPGRILLDDKNENVYSFRAHGGVGIICPRPWNKRHRYDTVPFIKDRLERLCSGV